jgi:hypothetical protein
MRVRTFVAIGAVVGGLVGTVRPVAAQSLGEIARKEAERRKEIKEPAKVYTNEDLGPSATLPQPPASELQASRAGASSAAPDASAPQGGVGGEAAGAAGEKSKDQAYWSGRRKELESKLDRDRTYAAALQSRISALTADFTARDDPAQRGIIERDRQKAVAELERLKRTIEDDEKAIASLNEEARRAGVPAGWLR